MGSLVNISRTFLVSTLIFLSRGVCAGDVGMVDTEIASVAVNGGSADTANGGFTCVRIKSPVLPSCGGGYVAIMNNNKLLVAAAMQAKSTNSKVWFYYVSRPEDNHHCPGRAFTPCSVISIEVQ